MEARSAATQDMHAAPTKSVSIAGEQAPNDCSQRDKTRESIQQTLQKASLGFGQSTKASLQGMDRCSRAMDVQALQAIYQMVLCWEGIQTRSVPCSPLGK